MTADEAAIAGYGIAVGGIWLAGLGLLISALGLGFAIHAIHRGNKASSASMVLTLNDGFRQAWQRYLRAPDEKERIYEFHELMNQVETACLIYNDKSIVGLSRKLLEDYLSEILNILSENVDTRRRIADMRNSPNTFEYLKMFLFTMRRKGRVQPIEPVVVTDAPSATSNLGVPSPVSVNREQAEG